MNTVCQKKSIGIFAKACGGLALGLSMALSGCVIVTPPPGANTSKVEAPGRVDANGKMINAFRAQNNLPPVSLNQKLVAAARQQSADMQQMGKLEHVSIKGEGLQARVKKHGYPVCYGAENIGEKYPGDAAIIKGWENSPKHRANMLNPNVTEYGMARVGDYYTLIFGSRC